MTAVRRKRGGRLNALRRAPTQALRTEFLIQAAALAVARWDRLSTEEQRRFRDLAPLAGRGVDALPKADRRELTTIWKKLEARGLIRELVTLVGRDPGSGASREGPGPAGSQPA